MQYEDIELVCLCGKPFVWTAGEQKFLQALVDEGKENRDGSPVTFTKPKRCAPCRKKKKEQRLSRGLAD